MTSGAAASGGHSRIWQRVSVFAALAVVTPFLTNLLHPTLLFSQDSWSYYSLAQTVFSNFYHPFVTRSYHEIGGYSESFPLLWPVLIAVVDRVVHLGAATQVVLALLCALASLFPIRIIARSCIAHRALAHAAALAVWVALLSFEGYRTEVLAGRTIPVAMLLLLTAFALLIRGDTMNRPSFAALTGLLLGLACLARFDALPLSLVVVAVLVLATRLRWFSKVLLVVSFAVGLLPWVAYSERHYGRVWASDNSFVALAAGKTNVRASVLPTETVLTRPGQWTARVMRNAARSVFAFTGGLLAFPLAAIALAAALAIALNRSVHRAELAPAERRAVLLLGAAFIGLAGQILTGYIESRYFSLAYTMLTLWTACFVVRRIGRVRVTAVVVGITYACIAGVASAAQERIARHPPPAVAASEIARLRAQYSSSIILSDQSSCEEIAARARIHMICAPGDWPQLSPDAQRQFVGRFAVTQLQAAPDPATPDSIEIVPVSAGLDRVSRREPKVLP